MAGRLEGRLALVTGASGGIGREIAVAFAREGAAAVALGGRSPDRLEQTALAVRTAGGRAELVHADLTRPGEPARMVREGAAALGGLDILVNAAGTFEPGTALTTDEETFDRTLSLNLKAVFLASREALNEMIPRGGGAIVNIASYLGLIATRYAVAYCASKGGVVLLTRAMALDHATQRVRVNCLCPGGVDTPMLRAAEPSEADLSRWSAEHPSGRLGVPADVAAAAVYLCSAEASWVTGAAFSVDGGLTAGW